MADGGPESCRMEGTSNCDIRTLDPAEPPEQDGCMTRKNVDFDFEESKLEHLTDWSRKEKEIDLLEKERVAEGVVHASEFCRKNWQFIECHLCSTLLLGPSQVLKQYGY
jgi:hypothetical protein